MKKVLITGCSSGIGQSCVESFARAGWEVVGTVRKDEDAARLRRIKGVSIELLDVTSAEACAALVAKNGPFDALVNNAGYGLMGPVEDLSDEEVRYQFEVNVMAPVRLARLVLPGMRSLKGGIIVNIGSVVGHFTYPLGGAYCATKHALRSFTDALRVETRCMGVRVVLIEPGPIATRFFERAEASFANDRSGAYQSWRKAAKRLLSQRGVPPADPMRVARVVLRVCQQKHPLSRVIITKRGFFLVWLRRLLPNCVWDRLMDLAKWGL